MWIHKKGPVMVIFGARGGWNHQDQEDFWGKKALEAIEASEAVEAAEVNEAA